LFSRESWKKDLTTEETGCKIPTSSPDKQPERPETKNAAL
jgi:hypothetical protein